ncbi:MAG TPA: beta-galactosidase [Phycisphaerae bacterium]|nr:beta-galactosidase [Phycisphaerae bacterium]
MPRPALFAALTLAVSLAAASLSGAPAPEPQAAIKYGPSPVPDGKIHKFAMHDSAFWIDNKPMRVIAGEMHPGRIQPEFWEDRIKKAKAMGLNTISVYLFWHQIEPKPGEFVFTGISDVRRFVKLCQDNGMWVCLRVGPYVCAETEFGGFPAWLLKDHSMRIRNNDPKFLNYCRLYLEQLAKQVVDLQINHGGPIILTQFENELSAINPYLTALHDVFVKAGFDGQLMTCDHSGNVWQTTAGIPGVLRGYNGIRSIVPQRITEAKRVNGDYPVFTPEFYTGWFDLWGGDLAKVPIKQQADDTKFLLDNNVSFTIFCVNGGTNFGFTAGSNAGRPMQTTYDYDAPIDELGRITPKYRALRDVLTKELDLKLPPVPADPTVISIPAFTLKYDAPLLAHLGDKPITSQDVKPMEDFDQSYGFTLYRTKIAANVKDAKLHLPAARDYAIVMLNGTAVADGLTAPKTPTFDTTLSATAGTTLDILVENMGRTSSPFDQANSRKGLEGNPTLNGTALTGWQVYTLPLNSPAELAPASGPHTDKPTAPSLYTASFKLDATGETYLDLSNFHFGVVWVNGHNLGRFWEIGACRSLYLPSTWQKKGDNEITVLELGPPPAKPQIAGTPNMIVTRVKPITPFWMNAAGKPLESVPGQGDDGKGLQ